ncbi:MAG: hypothetical protein U9O18_08065 [Chloroflexota bacterium]|nr:hypothetical protein [Chloroflexota bacterium]
MNALGLLLVVLGFVALGAGVWLLRRGGTGWRIGRLLSAAPQRSLSQAAVIAAGGEPAYIRIHGRIDSDEEFPGDDGKPVVFRRRRLQHGATRSGWQTFDDERLAVPFGLTERGERVAIDTAALGDGLVVVPRESEGVASDLSEEVVGGSLPQVPPGTPIRLRIEQVSTIDHATATGVPTIGEDGSVILGPGLGRPLLLTTLEIDEAMRVLASGHRSRLLLAVSLLVGALPVVMLGLAMVVLG